MDTSLRPQPNRPVFGTSDFAVSPVNSREYIDTSAEETCPAEIRTDARTAQRRGMKLWKRHPRQV